MFTFLEFRKKKPRAVDLSEVIDFKCILESYNQNNELPAGVFKLTSSFGTPVFGLDSRPGMQISFMKDLREVTLSVVCIVVVCL